MRVGCGRGGNSFVHDRQPAKFAHIANSGYGAGYYGYMWSEVLALDMLSVFGDNIMNPVVGRRFRDTILALANGGQVPAGTWCVISSAARPIARRFSPRSPASDKARVTSSNTGRKN